MLISRFFSEKFKQATASVENLKEEHESELQNYIEMCSGNNIQFHEKEKEVQSPFFFREMFVIL